MLKIKNCFSVLCLYGYTVFSAVSDSTEEIIPGIRIFLNEQFDVQLSSITGCERTRVYEKLDLKKWLKEFGVDVMKAAKIFSVWENFHKYKVDATLLL